MIKLIILFLISLNINATEYVICKDNHCNTQSIEVVQSKAKLRFRELENSKCYLDSNDTAYRVINKNDFEVSLITLKKEEKYSTSFKKIRVLKDEFDLRLRNYDCRAVNNLMNNEELISKCINNQKNLSVLYCEIK